MNTLMLEDIRLTLLTDAYMQLSGDSVFYPAGRDEWRRGLRSSSDGLIAVAVQPLLIHAGNEYTLVDTGFGDEGGPEGRTESLKSALSDLGISESAVSRVIITHSHGDHCMGNVVRKNGSLVPVYSQAEYYVQKREIESIRSTQTWWRYFESVSKRGQLRIVDGDTELNEVLACWFTPGHTVGHQSVLIRSGASAALYVGDLAVLAKNMERPEWGPDWAWSRKVDLSSRVRIAEWAADNNGILILGHDIEQPWIRLSKQNGGYTACPAT